MEGGQVEVFNNPFGDPPEAAAESEPEATVYMRIPASLKGSMEKAATVANLSLNSWMMRCAEQCLKNPC
jgi:predicted HicB family RNase H-like nuclease